MSRYESAYFVQDKNSQGQEKYKKALERCVNRLRDQRMELGLRNPKIGSADNRWIYCNGPDWVMGFQSGQYWLAYQLTGEDIFRNAAKARREDFKKVLSSYRCRDHDLGFQFSLHSVADWLMTGDNEARDMGLKAAFALLSRFRPEGGYLQAWTPTGPDDRDQARFANGRMIADTIQNLALLYWAHRETGEQDFFDIAQIHAQTSAQYLVREDDTSYHTFLFDPASGEPLRGETHQGFADESCWSRGQAWLMHGFTQCYINSGGIHHLECARRVCAKAETLLGDSKVPVWDYNLPQGQTPYLDSSAASIMAAGLYMLAGEESKPDQAARWRQFADRLLDGLLECCDLTQDPHAQGFLAHGAAHVPAGRCDVMLPYGDYYFMEALMRSQGHTQFFW